MLPFILISLPSPSALVRFVALLACFGAIPNAPTGDWRGWAWFGAFVVVFGWREIAGVWRWWRG